MFKNIPKYKIRKYCKDCGEYNHNNKRNNDCQLKIFENTQLRNTLKRKLIETDIFDIENDELFEDFSKKYGITLSKCKTLYSNIPKIELLKRDINIDKYFINIEYEKCQDCNRQLAKIKSNSIKIWKNNPICDKCWCNHEIERYELWDLISRYKEPICYICQSKKEFNNERYHFDHLNMFDKEESICTLVNEGYSILDIYLEINKCQYLCLECHHIVTHIEQQLLFTSIKSGLTKSLNNLEITEIEYNEKMMYYNPIYKTKMLEIYEEIKNYKRIK